MEIKATIDRFEDGKAVLIAGENKDEYNVPVASLLRGAIRGDWLLVKVEHDRIINVVIEEKVTASVKEKIANKVAWLRRWGHRQ